MQIWDAIKDGSIYSCPSLLATFSVICFADLKKYKFTYLSAFPALHSDPVWILSPGSESTTSSHDDRSREEDCVIHLKSQETVALVDSVHTWRYRVDSRQHGFFLAKKLRKDLSGGLSGGQQSQGPASTIEEVDMQPVTPGAPGDTLGYAWAVGSLADYEHGFFEEIPLEDRYVCFTDPSTYPLYPGWMLRNLLILIRRRWMLNKVQILCYRDIHARRDDARSIVLPLELAHWGSATQSVQTAQNEASDMPKVTGWERNSSGKVVSRIASLGEYMDPQR